MSVVYAGWFITQAPLGASMLVVACPKRRLWLVDLSRDWVDAAARARAHIDLGHTTGGPLTAEQVAAAERQAKLGQVLPGVP